MKDHIYFKLPHLSDQKQSIQISHSTVNSQFSLIHSEGKSTFCIQKSVCHQSLYIHKLYITSLYNNQLYKYSLFRYCLYLPVLFIVCRNLLNVFCALQFPEPHVWCFCIVINGNSFDREQVLLLAFAGLPIKRCEIGNERSLD